MGSSAVPRIIISASSAGAGKSLVVLALMVALHKKGLSVSCCVTGEALRQASLYSHITRRYTRVLDRRLLDETQIKSALCQASIGADVLLIDGHGGCSGGVESGELLGSDVELAHMTGTPIVLVQDGCSDAQTVLECIRQSLGPIGEPAVAGFIATGLSSVISGLAHPALATLNQAAESQGLPRFIGGLPDTPLVAAMPSGPITQDENLTTLPMQLFIEAGNLASSGIDLDALLAIAAGATDLRTEVPLPEPASRLCRFAVTDDTCFSLSYPDNLDLLRHAGAEILPFSPLVDNALPKRIGGLYVTGGYLKAYGKELAQNENMRRSIKQFADAGGVVYSEGAGTAFLCRSFQFVRGGPVFYGAGVIPAEAAPANLGRTMLTAQTVDDSVLGLSGLTLHGISLGDWRIGGVHAGSGHYQLSPLQIMVAGREPMPEGFSASSQSFSTFTFLHFGSCPSVATSLVEAAHVAERARERGELGR